MRTSLQEFGPIERRRALEAALVRMMAHPESERPFVVLEHRTSKCFVQFAGSLTKPLLFDVPALGISLELGSNGQPALYEDATALAFQTLAAMAYDAVPMAEQVGVLETSAHLVLEESVCAAPASGREAAS